MHRHSLSLITSLTSLGLWLIPASALYLGGCSSPTATVTNQVYTPEQLQQIARSITVKVLSGDNRGSGTLISRRGDGQNQVYMVLTNSHVVTPGQPYRIETPDGQVYPAELKGGELVENFAGKDAALLEFRSSNDYPVATQTGNSPTVGDKVLAAGFPYDGDGLVFAPGTVELLSDPALQGGYQVGYSSEIQQGMSGGPVLSSQGELVAINGMAAFPILQQAYTYMDGSRPDDALRQQMNRLSWGVPVAMLIPPNSGENPPNPPLPRGGNDDRNSPPLARGARHRDRPLTGLAAEVDEIAAKITVRIEAETGNGSGVIIAQKKNLLSGNTYYVATATHVVENKAKYEVVTPDGKRYPVDYGKVTLFPGVDLAVLQFSSQESYPVATLAEYKLGVDEQQWVFLSGWPGVQPGNPFQREFTAGFAFSEARGSVNVQSALSLVEGYELVYTNLSKGGMSGGPVLDTQKRVIGINAAVEGNMLGYSLGVPIRTLIGLASQAGIESEWLKVETVPPRKLTGEELMNIASTIMVEVPSRKNYIDWVNAGNQLWRLGGNKEAIEAFDQAIKISPNLYFAWYGRGLALQGEKRYREAIAAFEKVTEISSKISEAWRERGVAFARLKDYPQALASIDAAIKYSQQPDFKLYWLRGIWLSELERYSAAVDAYSEAIKVKPHLFAYVNRGNAWANLKEYEKAIADFNQAINLDPKNAYAYAYRGVALHQLGQYQKAIEDYTQVINLYPEFELIYVFRGKTWYNLNNDQKAIYDYTQAINLNPENAEAYRGRGKARLGLKQYKEAIDDYTQAINLDPKLAEAYYNRGLTFFYLEKYSNAIADFTQAINLDAKYADAYVSRGLIYYEQGDQERGVRDMKKAEQLLCQQGDPSDPKCELVRDTLKQLDK